MIIENIKHTISISMKPALGLSDTSISSPLKLLAGVHGFTMLVASLLLGRKAKVLSSLVSSSLGVSSRCTSSCPASSGYLPRSDAARGVRGWTGRSHPEDIRR